MIVRTRDCSTILKYYVTSFISSAFWQLDGSKKCECINIIIIIIMRRGNAMMQDPSIWPKFRTPLINSLTDPAQYFQATILKH
jgi:hypothetical protein